MSTLGSAPRIYPTLATHQRNEEWAWKEETTFLQAWADRLEVEFKLHIPRLVLRIDRLPCNVLGHFREGHNGLGLEGEIAINAKYLPVLEAWELLGILLHEMLHAWQACNGTVGKRSHHNRVFCDKGRELGLLVDRKGLTGYAADSPFKDLLRRFGVPVPTDEVPPLSYASRGDSKLKKWSCSCPVNVRVAVPDFSAVCLKCGKEFVRA